MKQRIPNRQSGHQTLLKAGYVAIVALMLQACQSTDGTQDYAINPHESTALLFSDNQTTPAATAKTALVSAMQEHLNSERYALTIYRYRTLPYLTADSIDAGSDSLWRTAIKTYDFKNNRNTASYQSDTDHTSQQDLVEGSGSPYLRYDDKVSGNTPAHALPKEVAMADAYQTHRIQIYSQYAQLRNCLTDASINLDQIIQENPTATADHHDVQSEFVQIDHCINSADQALKTLLVDAQSYQIGDIANIRQCAQTYRSDLRSVLAAHRKDDAFGDAAYDIYDMAWQKYRSCNEPFVKHEEYFEPYDQVSPMRNQAQLDMQLAMLKCVNTENQVYKNLQNSAKTLANDPKSHLDNYYQSVYCQALAVNEQFPLGSELSLPTNKAYADSLMLDLTYAMSDDADGSDKSKMGMVKDWFDAYKQMKALEQSGKIQPKTDKLQSLPTPDSMGGIYANALLSMMNEIKKTPEQLTASNLYQHDNTVITTLSHHKPLERKINTVLALDYQSATSEQSMQLPMQLDFMDAKISVDAAAVMPLLALASPKYAPSPDLGADVMHFGLPKSLQGVIPMSVVYDALVRAYLAGFKHMDAERFTPVVLNQDAYAREIGAAQVIKFSPTIQDGGKLIGIMLKQLATDLKAYVDANPEQYADHGDNNHNNHLNPAKIKALIDNWVLINQGHQTDDIGSALSLLQAIQPINSASHFYYYLDGRGKLIGMQFIQSTDQQLQNTRTELAAQIRFSPRPIAHAYSAKLQQEFNPPNAIDGTALIGTIRQDMKLKSLAQAARDGYQSDLETADTQNSH